VRIEDACENAGDDAYKHPEVRECEERRSVFAASSRVPLVAGYVMCRIHGTRQVDAARSMTG
jgi:hypothetical protein